MKIAMIASESNPFIKTGGLADVTFGLSKELASLDHDVVMVLPLYGKIRNDIVNKGKCVASFVIEMSWRKEGANIYQLEENGVLFYFIENRHYFERDNVYGYYDDGERFAFFSLAAIKTLEVMKFTPHIIHVHDWQSGIVPCLIKNKGIKFFKNTKFVFTIHNPAFLGLMDKISLGDLFSLPDSLFDNGSVRFEGMVSTFKAGLVYADKIVAVSPTHHFELLSPECGMRLEGVLRLREYDFSGILNGLDYEEFNPSEDKNIAFPYSISNCYSSKKKNKADLCKKLGIKLMDGPLFSLVSRLTWQKGMELVINACYMLAEKGCNIILLGSGENQYEERLRELQSRYSDRVSIYIGYNDKLAHMIYASSDFFLMPSLFEPCGLGQMIAQRYGTLPIVRRVGGLRDSVVPYDGKNVDKADGFGFDVFATNAMNDTCLYALSVYEDKEIFKKLMKNAMKVDHSWKNSVQEYLKVYHSLIDKK